MSVVFYPRGGSAQVVRYLSRALTELGHEVHLVTGSLRDGDPQHDAPTFYGDIPVTFADYTEAWLGFSQGHDPISGPWDIPFHPSYEDKPDTPDRVFYKVSPSQYVALGRCWEKLLLEVSTRFQPEVIHLHHLNHLHSAATQVFPSVARGTQLHGTELKMLDNLAAVAVNSEASKLHDTWHGLLARAAQDMDHFFAISPDVRQRAIKQFSISESDITTIPNGVDVSLFRPRDWSDDDKLAFLRRILVQDPKGWDESGVVGSVRYTIGDLAKLTTESGHLKPLAIFVGRFLDFKRVPLLLRTVSRLNHRLAQNDDWPPFNLLVWGGMPGEVEGQHPYTLARELDLPNVFFTGWLPHDLLSQGLNVADLLIAPSYYEPFGQVFLEAMATRMPVIGTRSGGPLSFVVDRGPEANGWLAAIDDVESLTEVAYDALANEQERKRRGANALALVSEKYDWSEIARRYVRIYRSMISSRLSSEA